MFPAKGGMLSSMFPAKGGVEVIASEWSPCCTNSLARCILEVPTISDLVSSDHSTLLGQEETSEESLLLPHESIGAEEYNEKCSHASSQRDHDT